ncbi:MAG: PIG-L family deacetylase [Patescibacteria group bacterium]
MKNYINNDYCVVLKKEDSVFMNTDVLLLIAPHPDDESLSSAGMIQRAISSGANVIVVFITNGDGFKIATKRSNLTRKLSPNIYKDFALLRQNEAIAALLKLGVKKDDIIFLGFPDDGLKSLYTANFKNPFTSKTTKEEKVPYENSYKYGDQYTGENLLDSLSTIIRTYKPTHIVYPNSKDNHKDHSYTSLFVKKAIEKENLIIKELTYLIHFRGWPQYNIQNHKKYARIPKAFREKEILLNFELTDEEISKKKKSLLSHKTQVKLIKPFFLAFTKKNEVFILKRDKANIL